MFANININWRKATPTFTRYKAASRRKKSHSLDCCTAVSFVQQPFEVYRQNSIAMLIRDLKFHSRLKLWMFDKCWTRSTEFQNCFAVLDSLLHPVTKKHRYVTVQQSMRSSRTIRFYQFYLITAVLRLAFPLIRLRVITTGEEPYTFSLDRESLFASAYKIDDRRT